MKFLNQIRPKGTLIVALQTLTGKPHLEDEIIRAVPVRREDGDRPVVLGAHGRGATEESAPPGPPEPRPLSLPRICLASVSLSCHVRRGILLAKSLVWTPSPSQPRETLATSIS